MDSSIFFIYPGTQPEPSAVTSGFLDDANEKDWDVLLSYMQTRHLRTVETLFTEGDADRALYLLTAGRLERVARSSTGALAATVDPPAPLNELAFLDGGRCTATVRALAESEVARLSYDAFESMAAREPNLARKILLDLGAILARRLRAAGL